MTKSCNSCFFDLDQQKKKKEEAAQVTAAGKVETARKEEEETIAASKEAQEAEEVDESEMTISSVWTQAQNRGSSALRAQFKRHCGMTRAQTFP